MDKLQLQLDSSKTELSNTNPRVFIGRDDRSCGLVSQNASISRRHAEIFMQGGATYIRDLGSSNGTWVNGAPVGAQPISLAPGQTIYVGQMPLQVEWVGGGGGATMMAMSIPPELKAMMEAHHAKAMAGNAGPIAPVATSPSGVGVASSSAQFAAVSAPKEAGDIGVGGSVAPLPAEYVYRRQGSNNNGVLLIALQRDTYCNNSVMEGFLEFTATDNETVASIIVELVEVHSKGHKKGHVWDRVLVRQGPWKTKKGDVLPMPFKLRIPPGTSISGKDCYWEVRGYVDINWAFDVSATSAITMRNTDIERIRDSLGALDYRVVNLESAPLGQRFRTTFQPPAQLKKKLKLNDIIMTFEYLGTNMKILLHLDKRWRLDKKTEFLIDLDKLRKSSQQEITQHFEQQIGVMMGWIKS